jgi:hypothetical protein
MKVLYNGDIIIVDDFLSAEECSVITKWLDNFNYEDLPNHEIEFWHKRLVAKETTTHIPGYEHSFDITNDLITDIKKRIINLLKQYENNEWQISDINFLKMWKGSHPFENRKNKDLEMFLHYDNQESNGYDHEVAWGCVIYPNSRYEGGELFYPKYNFKYRPNSGSLIMHKGNVRHGVMSMISGIRYSMASTIWAI